MIKDINMKVHTLLVLGAAFFSFGTFILLAFFEKEGGLIRTGPTQTNVMDLVVVLVENPE